MSNNDFDRFLTGFYNIFCDMQIPLHNKENFEEFIEFFKRNENYQNLEARFPQYKDISETILADSRFFKDPMIDEMAFYDPAFDEDPFFWENVWEKENPWKMFMLGKLSEKDMPQYQDVFRKTFLNCADEEHTLTPEFFFGFEKLMQKTPTEQKNDMVTKFFNYVTCVSKTPTARKKMIETVGELIKICPEYKNKFADFLKKEVKDYWTRRDNFLEIMQILKENNFFKNDKGQVPEEFKFAYELRFLNKEELSFISSNRASPWTKKNIGTYQKTVHQLLQKLIQEENQIVQQLTYARQVNPEGYQILISNVPYSRNGTSHRKLDALLEQGEQIFDKRAFRKNPQECSIYQENKAWLVPCAFYATDVFGDGLSGYLQKTHGIISAHDALHFLAMKPDMSIEKNRSLGQFLQKNILYTGDGTVRARPGSELMSICHRWDKLSKEEENMSYKDVLAKTESLQYLNARFPEFAKEAARWSVREEEYKEFENVYGAGLGVPTPFNPKKEFKSGNWTARFLPRKDPRVGFFGFYTDCCQHFSGIGKTCAVSSVKDADSQLFVIERDGEIFGGSWVWQNTVAVGGKKYKAVCFDNIEALGELKFKKELMDLYHQAGAYLTQEENVRKVTIGKGMVDVDLRGLESTEAIPLPAFYGQNYTDARRQVLLCENENAKPVEKVMPLVVAHHQKPLLAQTREQIRQ
ncbi:MAG: hypothetical protein J6U64_04790 [Alphaproteobacteria bacterium]|nr:hypothetical protein [Alphaproteobacteria bacterium]